MVGLLRFRSMLNSASGLYVLKLKLQLFDSYGNSLISYNRLCQRIPLVRPGSWCSGRGTVQAITSADPQSTHQQQQLILEDPANDNDSNNDQKRKSGSPGSKNSLSLSLSSVLFIYSITVVSQAPGGGLGSSGLRSVIINLIVRFYSHFLPFPPQEHNIRPNRRSRIARFSTVFERGNAVSSPKKKIPF
jgi:hypothetical protein